MIAMIFGICDPPYFNAYILLFKVNKTFWFVAWEEL